MELLGVCLALLLCKVTSCSGDAFAERYYNALKLLGFEINSDCTANMEGCATISEALTAQYLSNGTYRPSIVESFPNQKGDMLPHETRCASTQICHCEYMPEDEVFKHGGRGVRMVEEVRASRHLVVK